MAVGPLSSPEGPGTCYETRHSRTGRGSSASPEHSYPSCPRLATILTFFPEDVLVSPAMENNGAEEGALCRAEAAWKSGVCHTSVSSLALREINVPATLLHPKQDEKEFAF